VCYNSSFLIRIIFSGILITFIISGCRNHNELPDDSAVADELLLKNYRPGSVFNIPETDIKKAKFPVIDIHSHPFVKTEEEIKQWIRNMDETGIEKTIILTGATGAKFDSLYAEYSKPEYNNRFEVWCGFDYTGYDQPGFGPAAVSELERCVKAGARGVGELGDKGKGLFYSEPVKGWGMHLDDVRMDPLLDKCGELGIPINVHIAEPLWFYHQMDSTNDGLMTAYHWRLDNQKDIIQLDGMIDILERAVKKHPGTTFIACHLANLNHDLNRLGELLDKYHNLYADISARFAEAATIPRNAGKFYEKYNNKLIFGTDLGSDISMYKMVFRILESDDEHFYYHEELQYHWPLSGLDLSDETLKKIYYDNAISILKK